MISRFLPKCMRPRMQSEFTSIVPEPSAPAGAPEIVAGIPSLRPRIRPEFASVVPGPGAQEIVSGIPMKPQAKMPIRFYDWHVKRTLDQPITFEDGSTEHLDTIEFQKEAVECLGANKCTIDNERIDKLTKNCVGLNLDDLNETEVIKDLIKLYEVQNPPAIEDLQRLLTCPFSRKIFVDPIVLKCGTTVDKDTFLETVRCNSKYTYNEYTYTIDNIKQIQTCELIQQEINFLKGSIQNEVSHGLHYIV